MRALLIPPIALLTLATKAQTITEVDMPFDGLSIVYIGAAYMDIPTTGTAQTWDYSTLTPGPAATVDCVLPEVTG
ncbi:MAG TPA: hypothetical protein VHL57_06470, partial [Flavobacteriales bacterium]|nr:hypothetical protein [Flavobacteriales bacterium]